MLSEVLGNGPGKGRVYRNVDWRVQPDVLVGCSLWLQQGPGRGAIP